MLWLFLSVSSKMVEGISVVTTTWNEKENIKELILRIKSTLKDIPHEVIVVDDSSTDGTLRNCKTICRCCRRQSQRRTN